MITDDQLIFCKQCKNQSWEFTKGTICGLTQDYPSFSATCSSFELDEKKATEYKIAEENKKLAELEDKTLGLSAIGIKSQLTVGILVTVAGALLTLGTIVYMGIISLWTLGVIGLGIVLIFRGIKEKRSKPKENSSLDADI